MPSVVSPFSTMVIEENYARLRVHVGSAVRAKPCPAAVTADPTKWLPGACISFLTLNFATPLLWAPGCGVLTWPPV